MKKLIIISVIVLCSCNSNKEQEIKNLQNTSIDGRVCRSKYIKGIWDNHLSSIAEVKAMWAESGMSKPDYEIEQDHFIDTTGFFYDFKK